MKRILIIGTLLLNGLISRADYRPLELYEMIIKADKIVYGTIVGLDSNYYTLNIEGSLTSDSGTLKIARFRDWPCAARWTDYRVGQRLFLFLTSIDDDYLVMSAGNEGEHPIVDNSIFIHGFSIPIPPPSPPPGVTLRDDLIYFEPEHFDIYGGDYYGIQLDLDSFIESVLFIRTYFNFTYAQYRARTNWQIDCGKSELELMCQKSKLVNWVNFEATRKDER